jgi:hypothetical protein
MTRVERRGFIVGTLSLLAAPLMVEAQQAGKLYRVGVLLTATREETTPLWKALDAGLRELGYVEGRNLVIERRFADGRTERLPELASQLAHLNVDVIVAANNVTIAAAKEATSTIPIVMVLASEPVSAFKPTLAIQRLMTLPGVGLTLAVVIALEIGAVTRFPTAEKLARDAGCTCRVHATGGTLRDGRLRPDVNRYLKWAFIEAANAIGLMRGRHPHRHVSRLGPVGSGTWANGPEGPATMVAAGAETLAPNAPVWYSSRGRADSFVDPDCHGASDVQGAERRVPMTP